MSGVKFFNNVSIDGSQTVTGLVSSVSAVFTQVQLAGPGGAVTTLKQGDSNFANLSASDVTAASVTLTGAGSLSALSGSIVTQYGDLRTVSGRILSGDQDLTEIFAVGSPGDFGVRQLSALDDVDAAAPATGDILIYNGATQAWENGSNAGALLSAGGYTVLSNRPRINGDLTINGTLCALSGATFVNTNFITTSALAVSADLNTGPALAVYSNGLGDIASFYDSDAGVEVLHVGGNNGTFPNVGIKTSEPNKTLTVSGEISASGDVWFGSNVHAGGQHLSALYAAKGSTDAATSVVNSSSANWDTAYRQLSSGSLSAAGVGFTVGVSLSTPSLSAGSAVVSGSVNAANFYGDGSGLTNINAGNIQGFAGVTSVNGLTGAVTSVAFTTSANNFTQSMTGAAALFTQSVSSVAVSGVHYGDGSQLTGIASGVTSINGLTGSISNVVFTASANTFSNTNTFSQTTNLQALTATSGSFSGSILSAGQDLANIFGSKANTDSAYTAVANNSADWTVGKTLSTGGATPGIGYRFLNSNPTIYGDLTIYGTLNALSGATFTNTTFTTTSSLCVVNAMNVNQAALYIGASGSGDIASFYDIDANVEVLHVGGATGSFPGVGIRTSAPNRTLTVSGDISATGDITTNTAVFNQSVSSANVSANTAAFNTILSGGVDLRQAIVLSALPDVSLSAVTNGQVLKYDSTAGKWTNQSDAQGAGATTALSQLVTDVTISTPQSGQALVYDTADSKWKNTNLAISNVGGLQSALDGKQAAGSYAAASHQHAIGDLTSFNVVSPVSGQALVYDTADNKWKNILLNIANVSNLQTALDNKQVSGNYAAATHTHTSSQITDFTASVNTAVFNLTGTYIPPLVAGKVPATYIPLSVDDIVEVSTLSALTANNFPMSAMSNAMYVTTATNKIYRWSGSVYVEIAPSPGSTSEIAEGTNLYFTNARAVQAVSAASNSGGLANQLITPSMDGVATIGTSVFYSRADHIHPTDTSRAPIASPTFTGIPTVPTPANPDNTQQVANTTWVRTNFLNSTGVQNNAGALSGLSLAAATTVTAPTATITGTISAARYLGNGTTLAGVVTSVGGVSPVAGNVNAVATINGLPPTNGNFAGVAVTGSANTFAGRQTFAGELSSPSISGANMYGNLVAPVTTQTATFTLSLANAGGIIRIAPPTNTTVYVNVPTNATAFPVGTQTIIAQVSAATVTVSAAAGVTLLSYQSKTSLAALNSVASLIKTGANEWLLAGDIN